MNIDKIRLLCKANGISVTELERAVKLSNGAIGKWVDGYPRADNLLRVANYFGVSVDDLLRSDDSATERAE